MVHLQLVCYVDGACSGNPGPGGWGALLLIKNNKKEKHKIVLSGNSKYTTNNRMELKAVVESLKYIDEHIVSDGVETNISIKSDSMYVVENINKGYLDRWKDNQWCTVKGTEVSNSDLWRKLYQYKETLIVNFVKVKGHSGNKLNDFVDKVAVRESQSIKRLLELGEG